MAIDTETKRRSIIGYTFPALVFPVPDGDISAFDRRHIIGLYSGIGPLTIDYLPCSVVIVTEPEISIVSVESDEIVIQTIDDRSIVISEEITTVVSHDITAEIIEVSSPGPQGASSDELMPFAKRADIIEDSPIAGVDTIYRGEAAVGTLESQSIWRLRRILIDNNNDGDITEEWADGVADFTKDWTARASYTYS